MGRKLTRNVLLTDDNGETHVLLADTEVPAELASLVGDHCFAVAEADEAVEDKPEPRKASAKTPAKTGS